MAILKASRLPLFPLILAREKLARGRRDRRLGGEPLVMDELQGVKEYDEFGAAGEVGVHQLNALGLSRVLPEGGRLLDLGCGSGRLLARLARGRPDVRIVGLDLSEPMLETGRERLAREGLADRVELHRGDITDFDAQLADGTDAVSCIFALHHLPSAEAASRCLEGIAGARSRTGCAVWVFDFARLRHPRSWPAMASMIDWPGPVVLNDALASEQASFTVTELTELLERAGLDELRCVRARPMGEYQARWAPSRHHPAPVTGLWRDAPLPPGTGLLTRMTLQSFPRRLTQT